MGAGASAEGSSSIELFTVLMLKWDELVDTPQFAIDRPKPETYEDFLKTPIPEGGRERAFFLEMRSYFKELVKAQKKEVMEFPVNDSQSATGRTPTLQEALQQRNSNLEGNQQFRKVPNKRRKQQQAKKIRESCGPGAAFA